ncbi:ComEC/Rec2 family competence protein [Flavobacterium branchiicola]|uniref:ComEC/Rec2 family competence protein n=1 Tax=Flavobacterium branchiicola TaxID=1114875 RepID=A0ABV9P9L3_9FLAO|nr:ComEC/Rec2 family competence protein [Flavobacterium branchiicola]MBS7252917.1 ComEC family competence protein [Flavobacterium branchiicola]
MKVLDFPLAKITIWFLAGIIMAYYVTPSLFPSLVAFSLGAILFSICCFLAKKHNKIIPFFGVSTYYTSFFLGVLALLFHTDSLQKSNYVHCSKAFKAPQYITFTIREKLKSNSYNDRYTALISQINNEKYHGKIIVNIAKDSLKPIIIGNIIKTKTTLQHNPSNKNPNQFNYSKYLADRQIFAQIFVNKSEISINKKLKKDIWYYSGCLHRRIIRNLQKAHFNAAEMNVALALILGQQQEILPEIIQDYQYSGATHILSVSGLHVGFIMLFINFILKPIPNTRKGSFIKLFSVLISLGAFAVISGLSPSVLRSVVMFSFVATGNHLRRSGNIYHTLLVSLFLILLFEPYFLFDVGFQLSYIALFFIIWLQPLLKKIWSPKSKFLVYIWDALTVSFAAQIGAFPLCLYYFHQFPGLFFVTNIAIIPVLSFIMIAGIIVMIFAVFTSPPDFLVFIFEKSIYFLNEIIHWVASFESFVILDISFNFYYLVTFYFFIFSTIIWFLKPNFNKLTFVLITIILMQFSFIVTKKEIENQQELIVYNTKGKTLISEKAGKKIRIFSTDTLILNGSKDYTLNNYIVGNYGQLEAANKMRNLLFYKGKKVFIIDSSGIYNSKIQPDILLLIQNPKVNLERVLKEIHPKIVIADASNSYKIQKTWKATCIKKNIPFHATAEKGFYKLN